MTQGLPPVLPLPLAQTPMCGCVLKRRANLTGQERFRLRDLLRYNLRTARAYLLKEDFQQFWEYESPSWAGKFLDEWCCQVMRSRHPADEEDCQDATLAPYADPELFPRQEAVLQRRGRGSQQQGQTDHAKILRFPNLPRHGNRAVSCTWQAAGA